MLFSQTTYTTQIFRVYITNLDQRMVAPSIYQSSTCIFNSVIVCLVHIVCLTLKKYSSYNSHGDYRLMERQSIKINKAQVITNCNYKKQYRDLSWSLRKLKEGFKPIKHIDFSEEIVFKFQSQVIILTYTYIICTP